MDLSDRKSKILKAIIEDYILDSRANRFQDNFEADRFEAFQRNHTQ